MFISSSVDTFLVLVAAILVLTTAFFSRRQTTHNNINALPVLVLLHSIYVIYTLILRYPPNIFQRLKIPLNTPSETIRVVLLQRANLPLDAPLPRPLEALFTRLASFDTRTLFVRFGQTVIQDCEHCTTFDEYAIFAAPRIALGYVKEATVIGFLTIRGSGHERWRTYAVGGLVGAFILESYWLASTPIRIPGDGLNVFMWHDNLWLLRHLLFLALPILIHRLPRAPPTPSAVPLLAATRAELQHAHQRLSSARFVHAAVQRSPALRGASADWWDRQRVEGDWARADEHVRRAADKLGKGIEPGRDGSVGRLREKARAVLRQVLESLALVPSVPAVETS